MDEVINWRHFSDQQRDHVMANLSGENASHTCPSCSKPAQCDISQGKDTCWCFEIEKRDTSSIPKTGSCLCRKCLSKLPVE